MSAYAKINELANPKKIIFVIIPSQNDILRYQLSDFDESYKDQYWFKSFINFINKNNKIYLLDLMSHLPEQTNDLFFSCDQHWNSKGNAWAANKIHSIMAKSAF